MRKLTYTRWVPSGEQIQESCDLLKFIRSEASLGMAILTHKRLPPLDEVNRVLQRGNGDDGFIGMTWTPFMIDGDEYAELEEALA